MEGDLIIEKSVTLGEQYKQKKEKLAEADKAFMKAFDQYLSQRPDLKKLYEEKLSQKVDAFHKKYDNVEKEKEDNSDKKETSEKVEDVNESKVDASDFEPIRENPDIKRIYREIVKITHPDKLVKRGYTESQMKKMAEHYETATKAYEKQDLLPLVRIGAILYLPMNLSEESLNELEVRVMNLQQELAFIETTFAWSWYHAPNQNIKDQMLIMFLNQILSK